MWDYHARKYDEMVAEFREAQEAEDALHSSQLPHDKSQDSLAQFSLQDPDEVEEKEKDTQLLDDKMGHIYKETVTNVQGQASERELL